MNVLELAQMNDLEICMDIIKDGKNFQNEQGFTQWTDDYPNIDTMALLIAVRLFFKEAKN